MHEIPERFWSLFRSVNRATYIEALLKINEEYEYSNYFLSREMCIQLLSSYFGGPVRTSGNPCVKLAVKNRVAAESR